MAHHTLHTGRHVPSIILNSLHRRWLEAAVFSKVLSDQGVKNYPSGASLKLSILNPKGRVWTMVAGGGASVIYADTVGDLGFAEELGNYAEYSGAPNTQACTS